MQINELISKVKAASLTCSEVVQLLHDQPTADETSHAHMHMRDGFPVAALEWQQAEYAHTTLSSKAKIPVYDPSKGQLPPPALDKKNPTFSLDANRTAIPARPGMGYSKYDLRSGLPEIAEQPETGQMEPYYKILQKGSKPLEVAAASQPTIATTGPKPGMDVLKKAETSEPIPSGDKADYAKGTTPDTRKVFYKYTQLTPKVPKIPGSEEHTMFEDSESMAMHLTAALLSSCGLHVLETLEKRGPGSALTVGLFSRSAVHAVKHHIASATTKVKADPQVLMRTANVTAAPRTTASPNPIDGTFSFGTRTIDHIVVVLGLRSTGDVNVVTCYPSPVPTMATIKTSNAPDLDIEEHEIGKHITAAAQAGSGLKLKW